jgi:hypothetical protein
MCCNWARRHSAVATTCCLSSPNRESGEHDSEQVTNDNHTPYEMTPITALGALPLDPPLDDTRGEFRQG